MKRLLLLLIFLSQLAIAHDGQSHLLVSYYEGLGTLMRVERVVKYVECQEIKLAEVILIDKTNELREMAMLDEKGNWIGSNKNNKVMLKKIITLFQRASSSKAACLVEKEKKEIQHLKEVEEQKNLDALKLIDHQIPELTKPKKTKEVLLN